MAKSGAFGDIVMLGLFGGAAYIAWNWWSSLSAPVVAATTPAAPATTAPPPNPPTTPVTITNLAPTPTSPVSTQMQNWANSNGMGASYIENGNSANPAGQLDADHWSAIYTFVTGNTIDGGAFDSVFFPQGRPADVSMNPVYTAPQFIHMLVAGGSAAYAGLSGPAKLVPVPMLLGGQRHVMNLPAGTTPAQLQAMLRGR